MTRKPFRARLAWTCAAALLSTLAAPANAIDLAGSLGSAVATAGAAIPIPDQYIVSLRKAPAGDALAGLGVAAQAQTLLAGIGAGQPLYVYETALRGFAVRMSAAQAALLRQHPLVARIEQDQQLRAVATQSGATWGLDRIDQRNLPLDASYRYPDQAGQGVHVYVIDTGINASHSEFTGRVGSSRNFVGGVLGLGAPDPNAWNDCNGHGTHVSGTAAGTRWGVAKKATIHAVRVLDCLGTGSNSAVIAGIDYVAQNHVKPATANMSLGGGDSAALDSAVRGAVNAGVTMVVAAGNDNANACSGSPNKEPLAITVGATAISDARASYSNFGSCLDLFAPGSDITSADYQNTTGSTELSGTSMAAPHVAGASALLLGANPALSPAQVTAQLLADSTPGVVASAGSGSPNKLLYVAAGGGTPTDAPPVASFTAACSNLACAFDGSGSSDDHGIAAYSWTFGDGSGGNGASLSHAYAAAGSYSVRLTVTDSVGQSNTRTQTVTVSSAGSGPCSDCTKSSGTLASGATAYSPNSSGFASGGGQFKGYLRGPAGSDFDLYLERFSSGLLGGWSIVARAETTSNNEDIVYSGGAGTYRWRIKAYSGSGAYDFYFRNP